MVANQTVCSRLEQSSVIKFLLAEKCKLLYRGKEKIHSEIKLIIY